MSAEEEAQGGWKYSSLLVVTALGVVFGDIGTSPLYALRECFAGAHGVALSHDNMLGVLSLIFWAFILVISLKYIGFVMQANNQGEGGVLALMALALRSRSKRSPFLKEFIVFSGLFGGALLYGDSVLTTSISVLSAVEGLKVATPAFESYVVGITILILMGLFYFQKLGTGRIGIVFGPIIICWFIVIALLGVHGIMQQPEVLEAFSPHWAVTFFVNNGMHGFLVLGGVFLVVTGGEALYADLGHFGRKPILRGWFFVALPCLLLNYLGQGAIVLANPENLENPFYRLAPPGMIYPLVVLAAAATVIASQAVITGAFSITRQAVQLGYLPRLQIDQTSSREYGQIYVPQINSILFVVTIAVVLIFRTSSNLAAAYGIAVSSTMVITIMLTYVVAHYVWRWSTIRSLLVVVPFLIVDLAFWGANVMKIFDGGWIPLLIGGAIFTVMTTWHKGRKILSIRMQDQTLPLEKFFADLKRREPVRVPGIAVFLVRNVQGTPPALVHNLEHNKVLHQAVILLTIVTERVPVVPDDERIEIQDLGNSFYRVITHFGFTEDPDVPQLLTRVKIPGVELQMSQITFFLGRETLFSTDRPGMAQWREGLFSFLSRNAHRANSFYRLPPERVVEIGMVIEL